MLTKADSTMGVWDDLRDELQRFDQPLLFWWRDDDACKDTQALQKLLSLAKQSDIPVHLAVIPELYDESLSNRLNQYPNHSFVLQHGISHSNNALPEQRKIELGGNKNLTELTAELSASRQDLMTNFKDAYLDILVPPWNRLDTNLLSELPGIGYKRLSVLGERQSSHARKHNECVQLNVHLDIIDWQKRCFRGDEIILNSLIAYLQNKRRGEIDPTEPCGLMTHHLDHDPECWSFLSRLFAFLQKFDQVIWLSGRSLESQ